MVVTFKKTVYLIFFAILFVATHSNAQQYQKAPIAHYNQYSAQFNTASIDRLLARDSATEGVRAFVPAYPIPQQHYIRVPAQAPVIAPTQQFGAYYQPPAPYRHGW